MLVEIFSHADFAKLIRCVVQHKFAWFESEERRHEIHLQQNITIHIEYVYNVSQLELYTFFTAAIILLFPFSRQFVQRNLL